MKLHSFKTSLPIIDTVVGTALSRCCDNLACAAKRRSARTQRNALVRMECVCLQRTHVRHAQSSMAFSEIAYVPNRRFLHAC